MGIAEKHHKDGFAIFLYKNGNGVSKEVIEAGEGATGFFNHFLNEDEDGKKIVSFLVEKYRKCMLYYIS